MSEDSSVANLRDLAEDDSVDGVYVNSEGHVAFRMAILSKTGVSPPQ